MPHLLGIATKPRRKAPLVLKDVAMLSSLSGVVGDWRGKPGKRQVTLMSLSDWHIVCDEIGTELPWQTRRANLLVDALPLYQSTGSSILLGDALLEVTGEADPCERMEQEHPGLFQALVPDWRGGITCRVIRNGVIRLGMEVKLVLSDG